MKIENITFSKLFKNANGSSKVYMNVEDKQIILPTPKLKNSFGANDYNDNKRFSVRVKLEDDKLTKNLHKIDEHVLKSVASNKELYKQLGLKKKPTVDSLEMLYIPIVKSDDKYGESFNIKLPTVWNKDVFKTVFYDTDKERLHLTTDDIKEHITYENRCKYIIHVESIWFVNGKFGVTISAKQVLIYPSERELVGYNFSDSEDDKEEEPVLLL